MKPIYYIELDLVINFARSSHSKHNTWFITTVKPDSLYEHLKKSNVDFARLVYIAFKKRSKTILNGKIKNFQIKIKKHKKVGVSNVK